MKYLFFLSGENISLSFSELKALFELFNINFKAKKINNLLVLDSDISEKDLLKICERSSMIKCVNQILYSTKSFDLKKFEKVDWNKIVKSPFCVRIEGKLKYSEAKLASPIWKSLKKPSVDLVNPKTTVQIIVEKDVYITKLIWQAPRNRYAGREPKEKPAFHPTALKPKLSRLLVNLSRVKPKEMLLDPFCGAGAILIEANILKCKAYGSDIDDSMIKRSKTNLKHYNMPLRIKKVDATKLSKTYKSFDAIATDPPYGMSTKVGAKSVSDLYSKLLSEAHKVLKKKKYLAFMHPNFVKIKVDKKKWKLILKEELYVHGGLTRKIIVLKKL